MKAWKNLGVVETIYEEEYEFSSSSSSLSPSPSSPPTPLHSRVEKWSLAEGRNTEVLIRVRGKCFHLHKDPLTSRSTYLKRQLTDSVTELTLSPPLNISPETFTLVADFCYGARPVITPFNLAALRTASELLEMTESNGEDNGDDSLVHVTDTYFRRVVAVNSEYASVVFRSSLALLPEAETAAFLVSGCVEALNLTDSDGVSDGGSVDLIEDVILTVCPEDFHIVAEAMQRRFNSHDVVYKIVDLYIRGQKGKITEDQKSQICSAVDCTKLSPNILLDAVQNPSMPLRFVVRAMLVDQLNTRRCLLPSSAAMISHRRLLDAPPPPPPATLGALLQRDAALRQASHLKASLDATTLRIRSLELELSGMRKLLAAAGPAGVRSASFRVDSGAEIRKDDRLSASSGSFPFARRRARARAGAGAGSVSASCGGAAAETAAPGLRRRIGKGLINGIKKAFGVKNHGSSSGNSDGFGGKDRTVKVDGDDDGDDHDHGWELSLT